MLNIGGIELHLINDGFVMVDGGGAFGLVPRVLWERVIEPDELNRVPMSLLCLLLRAEGKNILVDTGIGNRLNEKQRRIWGISRPQGGLLDGLARIGLAPEDVDIVINTHLHSDHCGGNTCYDADGRVIPTFPNAEYWVQRLEYADACFPNERTRATYIADNFRPLEATGQLRLIDGDVQVVKGVRCVVTRGHTRAHQSVIIGSDGEYALLVADMASYAANFERLAWLTAYDVEPLVNLETKRNWQRWAQEHDALLIFEHDTQRPTGKLRGHGKGMKVEPVEVPWT